MAEVKNSFLASKMNQDLDDRLVPQNEYRSASNISIVSSNNSNNGVIQNISGNSLLATVGSESSLEIIGQIADEVNSFLYVFLTNYTDISFNGLNDPQPVRSSIFSPTTFYSRIVRLDLSGKTATTTQVVLVDGPFLNFSKNSPIIGINIIEDLLFWTDNRNQPRKININTAVEKGVSYYTTEDHISVAKYSPVTSISFINGNNATMRDVVSQFNPDGTTNLNYNANFIGDKTFLQDKFVRFSYRFKYDDNEYSILAPFSQIAFVPQQDGSFMGTSTDVENDENTAFRSSVVEFMKNKINQVGLVLTFESLRTELFTNLKIKEIDIIYKESNSTTCYVLDTIKTSNITFDSVNLYTYVYTYESRKPKGNLSEDQLVRVYDKVPVRALSQETVGGRVMYANYIDKHTPPLTIDYRVTINKKSTKLSREFPLHTVKSNRNYQVGIVLSDRYGRQSDVILSPVIAGSSITGGGSASSFYAPWYNPTLDSSEATGGVLNFFGNCISVVFQTQMLTSAADARNPISNVDRSSTGTPGLYSPLSHALSAVLDANSASDIFAPTTTNLIVYETATLKPVFEILVTLNIDNTINSMIVINTFASVFAVNVTAGGTYYFVNNASGLKSYVNPTSVSIANPTGWYSYKIVVKQQQQEYYNVYAAGALAGYPAVTTSPNPFPTGEDSKTSHLILFSDNINKIPRDLSLIGPEQKQFRSSTQLFGRVQNIDVVNGQNEQFYPDVTGFSVPNIEAQLNVDSISNPTNYYQLQDGVIVARTNNNNVKFGALDANLRPKLCILETDPVLSNLDIYWETSTSGLISDLNKNIAATDSPGVASFSDVGWTQYESQAIVSGKTSLDPNAPPGGVAQRSVTKYFYCLDSNNVNILRTPTNLLNVTLLSVTDLTGTVVTGLFALSYSTVSSLSVVYLISDVIISSNPLKNQYILNINTSVIVNGQTISRNISIQGELFNVTPIIYTPGQTFQGALSTSDKVVMPPLNAYRGIINIYQFKGQNGALYFSGTGDTRKQTGLIWSFQDGTDTFNEGTGTTAVSLNISTTGFLKVAGGDPGIRVRPVIKLTDGFGGFALLTLDLDFTLGEFNQGEFTAEYNI